MDCHRGCIFALRPPTIDQERRLSLNIVERDLLMGNRVQLDTTHGYLPGRNTYVYIGQWYLPLGDDDQGRHRLRPTLGKTPTRGAFSTATATTTSRTLVAGHQNSRDHAHSNEAREVVRAVPQSLQSQPAQQLQALISSLEQIELRLQRTEEQSDIRDAEHKKAIEDMDARQAQKIKDSETRLTLQMQNSIASSLQEQASNAAKQARI